MTREGEWQTSVEEEEPATQRNVWGRMRRIYKWRKRKYEEGKQGEESEGIRRRRITGRRTTRRKNRMRIMKHGEGLQIYVQRKDESPLCSLLGSP